MYSKEIDKKWQAVWDKEKPFKAQDFSKAKKFYTLVEFPYPSGVGLHVGHARAYMGLEAISRKRRLQGYNVLFPIGFDAFGLPTENYAMKTGIHPRKVTDKNIEIFTKQLKAIGFSFDYDRVIDTTTPEYFKWTQWIFIKLFEKGLAYKEKTYVNFCPNCRVILANEEAQGGKCDRCDSQVVQKEKEVWMLKITDYAEKLLEGLNEVNFAPRVELEQKNWIGKSKGAQIKFNIVGTDKNLEVYTTRPDTIFGVTYMAIAPEHNILDELKTKIENFDEIIDYRQKVSEKSEFERVQLAKDKTGVEVKGVKIKNPVTGENIPLWITDYVMLGYGTGAIMAVPAHDQRDFEFAKKFGIDIKQVIAPVYVSDGKDKPIEGQKFEKRNTVSVIIKHPENEEYIILDWKEELGWKSFVIGGVEKAETIEAAALREMKEETGFFDVKSIYPINAINYSYFFAAHKAVNREAIQFPVVIELKSLDKVDTNDEETKFHTFRWVKKEDLLNTINLDNQKYICDMFVDEKAYTDSDNSVVVNSKFLDGLSINEAKKKAIEYIKENKLGAEQTNYHMKDWAFARQRYWGEPVPIVHCKKCGMVPLNESELPLKLPELENFVPGVDGESPLSSVDPWVNTTCPKCGGAAKRETDTMPQWAGSSWYFLRYIDPFNNKEFAAQDKLKYWLMVDWYNGGMEHVTRHMIYSRFWHRFLYDIGEVPTKEPYGKRTVQGLILGSDGEKMSKSRGNVVNPDDIINEYGADTLRTYVLFIGEYSQSAPWSDNGVKGAKKFLDRVLRLEEFATSEDLFDEELERELNFVIKKVTSDLEEMKFNTAIAAMMTYVNFLYKRDKVSKNYIKSFLQILNPIAPHVTEELWQRLNLEGYLFESKWPEYNEAKLVKKEIELAVQINGSVKFKINVASDADEAEIKKVVLEDERLEKYLAGKDIKKVIVIKSRLVNIVAN